MNAYRTDFSNNNYPKFYYIIFISPIVLSSSPHSSYVDRKLWKLILRKLWRNSEKFEVRQLDNQHLKGLLSKGSYFLGKNVEAFESKIYKEFEGREYILIKIIYVRKESRRVQGQWISAWERRLLNCVLGTRAQESKTGCQSHSSPQYQMYHQRLFRIRTNVLLTWNQYSPQVQELMDRWLYWC